MINKVILVGRLGKDPEVRHMSSGDSVASVSMVTSEHWKDKAGERQERSDWHNLVFYKKLAEIVGEYLKKGALIYVEGKTQTREWEDKEGNKRWTTEIIVSEMKMLGGKSGEKHEEHQEPAKPAKASSGNPADFSDDIPF